MVGVGAGNDPVGVATPKLALVGAGLLEVVQASGVSGLVEVPWVRAQEPGLAWVGMEKLVKATRGYPKVRMPCSES